MLEIEAFQDLYAKYQDTGTSPATESLDHFLAQLNRPFTYFYFIEADHQTAFALSRKKR